MNRNARIVLWAYAAVAVLQLLGLALSAQLLISATKPLLIPLLICFVLASVKIDSHRTIRLLLVGLFFSWIGDLALMSSADIMFIVGMLGFLVTHICYISGFFALGFKEQVDKRRWVLFVYPAFWLVANAALWPGLGALRIPILVYSAFLVAMALTAMGLNPLLGLGGFLFMISDLMIGENAAYGDFSGSHFLIMLTYIVGQLIIVIAWLKLAAAQPEYEKSRSFGE